MTNPDRIERLLRDGSPGALRELVVELRRTGDEAALRAALSQRARPLSSWLGGPRSPDHRVVFALGDALLAALEQVHAAGRLQIRWAPDAIFVVEHPQSEAPWATSRFEVVDLGPSLDHWDPAWLDWSRPDLGAGECARYLSPEQLAGECELDITHDTCCVGLIVCDLYAGLQPWEDPGMTPRDLARARQAFEPAQFPHRFAAAPHDALETWLVNLFARTDGGTATGLRDMLGWASRMASVGVVPGHAFIPELESAPMPRYGGPPILGGLLRRIFGR